MLLALDIGNTETVFGLHDGRNWLRHWRLASAEGRTVDEFAAAINSLLSLSGYSLKEIDDMALASVVPPLTAISRRFGQRYLGVEPLVVGAESAGIEIIYENPKSLGADRIANAVAAYEIYRQALIVIDFGTATTMDYISPGGRFEGGLIAPGLMVTGQALFQRTSQLPEVDVLKSADSLVATDTVSAMTVGLFQGYVSLVEGLIAKLRAEVKTDPAVVATGGLARIVAAQTEALPKVEPDLTLEGIRLILERHRRTGAKRSGRSKGS